MRAQSGGVLATIVVALVALIVLVGWTVRARPRPRHRGGDPSGGHRAGPPAASGPDRLPGRRPGRGSAHRWPGPRSTIAPRRPPTGSAARRSPSRSSSRHPPPVRTVWVSRSISPRLRDRGPAGFDPDHDVICAFVDTSDPMTDDAGTLASVDVDPVRGAAGSLFTVEGLDPGDEVVVEAWAAITSSGAARAGSPTATLRSRSIPGGRRLDASESLARDPGRVRNRWRCRRRTRGRLDRRR